MALHGSGCAFSPKTSNTLCKRFDMTLGLDKVLFKSLLQLGVIRGLCHFRQCLRKLPLGMKQVLQLFYK